VQNARPLKAPDPRQMPALPTFNGGSAGNFTVTALDHILVGLS